MSIDIFPFISRNLQLNSRCFVSATRKECDETLATTFSSMVTKEICDSGEKLAKAGIKSSLGATIFLISLTQMSMLTVY